MFAAEELTQKITSWIRGQVLEAGCRGVVVGMSGGLDSSTVAVLCQRALPDATLGVIMPCHSDPGDAEHALAVARKFGIATRTIALDEVFDLLLTILPGEGFEPATRGRSEANLKPRLRMITLYYLANRLGYLVAGSGNRCELSIGYFTKYGDGGVDIQPMGNLVKGQVRELATYLGIPREIIDKPPSAGLWPGQTDEQEIGLTYEELDRYLLTEKGEEEIRTRIEAMIAASSHKRCPPKGTL